MSDKVIDLNAFKRKKQEAKPQLDKQESMDFADRTSRIRKSLERINTLMDELKGMSKNTDSNNQKR